MSGESKEMDLVSLIERLKGCNTSDSDIKKNFRRYIEDKARKNHIPLNGKFELTPLCNLDCKMCYVHLDTKQFSKSQLLSVEIWEKIIDDAHSAGMMQASLTGGECLTYPGFDEIYLYLYNKGIVPCILSNGILLNIDRIKFLKRKPPSHIQITLYGSSDDAYEKVTGHRAFSTVYHNLEMLRDEKLHVGITLTPSSYMRDDIRDLQEVAESLKIPYGINANLITPRENTGRELKDLDVDEYMEIYRIWNEIKKEELTPVNIMELPDENRKGKSVYGLECGAGRSSFTIQYTGRMAPCPSLADITTDPLDEGFINAWHRLNKLVATYPMPGECSECVYHDVCMICPAIHNNAHNPGHCDPRICERTRKLVQGGFIKLPDKK